MSSKKINAKTSDKYYYDKIIEEEIIYSYENKFGTDDNFNKKNKRFSNSKRGSLEIINRLLFFFFIGSFIFSLFLIYSENKIWFIFYVLSALSCIIYTPNRKALKELIAAWPNVEDLIKGRSLWRKKK